ncbi:hypothetical protein [Marinobacter nauticus]|uniref:hypothetical protein n=1 Tax=Marinobacter nauticus TaxID=2743 RepID=UPI003514BF8D
MEFKTVLEAFEFTSMGPPSLAEAYVNRDTGEYFIVTDFCDSEQLPDDLDSDKYIVLPNKNELDLGKRLVLRFAIEYLDQDYEEVEFIFQKKGAYSRFKALLERKSLLEKWYEYESQAQEQALREWCQDVGLEVNG